MPQSGISKIENPAPGGRRAITVEEALAFSRVLEIPLLELLLPTEAAREVDVLRYAAMGPALRAEFLAIGERYDLCVRFVASQCLRSDAFRARMQAEVSAERLDVDDKNGPRRPHTITFLDDVLEEAAR